MVNGAIVRKNVSFVFEILSVIFLLIAVVVYVVNQRDDLVTANTYCSVKIAFGLYSCALVAQIILLLSDCVAIVVIAQSQGVRKMDLFHIKINLNTFCSLTILVAIIIEGSGTARKHWQIVMCVMALVLSTLNAVMWSIMQWRRREKQKKEARKQEEKRQKGGASNCAIL